MLYFSRYLSTHKGYKATSDIRETLSAISANEFIINEEIGHPWPINSMKGKNYMFDRILIFQHKGGEYISINISGLSEDREPIWETLNRVEEKLRKPSITSNVAFQILDSKLSKDEIERIVNWFKKMKSDIYRIVIIGATFREKYLISKSIKKAKIQLNEKYIYDWDTAKDWLVGKAAR